MIFIILSDIHANLTALDAVLEYVDFQIREKECQFLILGDFIDYGPRPNEVIDKLKNINCKSIIIGNHEHAYLTDEVSRFSSKRGIDSLNYTASILNSSSKEFIASCNQGKIELELNNKKILLVHGDLSDIYWGSMSRNEMEKEIYSSYDFVLSGHTHIPHFIEYFYSVDNQMYRNKKKTTFINPGSVGQPRNHNNHAQFCIIDFLNEKIVFERVKYNIMEELTYFNDKIDFFYKERLKLGV